jgi:ATP-dependent Clp protease ATP-binding subunit ClpA
MSEYMEKFSISRFVEAPPGYVGYTKVDSLLKSSPQTLCSSFTDEIEKHIQMYLICY